MNLNLKKNFDECGVIVIKKLISKNELSKLKKKIQNYIQKQSKLLKGKDINFVNNQVNSLHNFKDKFFKTFSTQDKIKNISKILLNSKPKFRKCEYFAKPKKIGLASPLHQDNFYWNLSKGNGLTIWLPLENVSKKNGSLIYLLKSHKFGNFKHEPSFAPGSSQKVSNIQKYKKKFKSKIYEIKAGDCLIHHSQIIHGSRRNLSNNSRKVFTIQYQDEKEKINLNGLKKYKDSLKMQIKKRIKN